MLRSDRQLALVLIGGYSYAYGVGEGLWQGDRAFDPGGAAHAILMRVYRTLKLRGLNPTQTLTQALRTYVTTAQLPPLPNPNIADG